MENLHLQQLNEFHSILIIFPSMVHNPSIQYIKCFYAQHDVDVCTKFALVNFSDKLITACITLL